MMEEDVFEVRVNATGSAYMQQITRIVKFMYIGAFALSVLLVFSLILRFAAYSKLMNSIPLLGRLQIYSSYFYIIIIIVLLPAQLYYYLRFCRGLNEAVDYSNSANFNESFSWLLRHAVISLFMLIIEFLMEAFNLAAAYELFRMIRK